MPCHRGCRCGGSGRASPSCWTRWWSWAAPGRSPHRASSPSTPRERTTAPCSGELEATVIRIVPSKFVAKRENDSAVFRWVSGSRHQYHALKIRRYSSPKGGRQRRVQVSWRLPSSGSGLENSSWFHIKRVGRWFNSRASCRLPASGLSLEIPSPLHPPFLQYSGNCWSYFFKNDQISTPGNLGAPDIWIMLENSLNKGDDDWSVFT